MKPKNTQARKLKRQKAALARMNPKSNGGQPQHERDAEYLTLCERASIAEQVARDVRTKKHGTKHDRMARWARG